MAVKNSSVETVARAAAASLTLVVVAMVVVVLVTVFWLLHRDSEQHVTSNQLKFNAQAILSCSHGMQPRECVPFSKNPSGKIPSGIQSGKARGSICASWTKSQREAITLNVSYNCDAIQEKKIIYFPEYFIMLMQWHQCPCRTHKHNNDVEVRLMHCANWMEGIDINFFLKQTKFNFSTCVLTIEAELKEPDRSFQIIH